VFLSLLAGCGADPHSTLHTPHSSLLLIMYRKSFPMVRGWGEAVQSRRRVKMTTHN